ncbi:MAG: NAD(P)-binding protein [Clostridia bacterium]|nr:NAD(P)-binding protein [Clostridia bacterium]
MKWDVIVIGAGPAGSFTAQKIAASGFKVALLEEDSTIGEPLQCSGLISPRALEIAGVDDDIVINRLRGLRVFSPLGATLQVENSRVYALAIDRVGLDRKLAQKALNAGAVLFTNTEAKGLEYFPGGVPGCGY